MYNPFGPFEDDDQGDGPRDFDSFEAEMRSRRVGDRNPNRSMSSEEMTVAVAKGVAMGLQADREIRWQKSLRYRFLVQPVQIATGNVWAFFNWRKIQEDLESADSNPLVSALLNQSGFDFEAHLKPEVKYGFKLGRKLFYRKPAPASAADAIVIDAEPGPRAATGDPFDEIDV